MCRVYHSGCLVFYWFLTQHTCCHSVETLSYSSGKQIVYCYVCTETLIVCIARVFGSSKFLTVLHCMLIKKKYYNRYMYSLTSLPSGDLW